MQFRLLAPHYIKDQYLDAGTIVGAGTQWPWEDETGPIAPSLAMVGVDAEGVEAVNRHRVEKGRRPLPSVLPEPMHPANMPVGKSEPPAKTLQRAVTPTRRGSGGED